MDKDDMISYVKPGYLTRRSHLRFLWRLLRWSWTDKP